MLFESRLVEEVVVTNDLSREECFSDADSSEDEKRFESFRLEFLERFDR